MPTEPWLIAEVSLILSADRGTVADLKLMPKQAFTPEPANLNVADFQLFQALQQSEATAARDRAGP